MRYETPISRHSEQRSPPVYQTLKALYQDEERVSVPGDDIRSYTADGEQVSGFFEDDIRQRLDQRQTGNPDDASQYSVKRGMIRSTAWNHPCIDIHVMPSATGDDETWIYTLDDDTVEA